MSTSRACTGPAGHMHMKIASNDYLSNMPGTSSVYSGGPKGFLTSLSAHFKHSGDTWVSLADKYVPSGKPSAQHVQRISRHSKWLVHVPVTYMQKRILKTQTNQPAPHAARELIATIRSILHTEQPDLVFINGLSVFAWALLQAAHAEHIPVVVQHAGIWTIELDNYAHLFSSRGLQLMKGMERDFAKQPVRNIFLNEFSRRTFERIVAPVRSSARSVIPLPCLITKPARASRQRPGAVSLGIVARWDRIKNHAAVLALAQEAQRRNLAWKFFAVTRIPNTAVQKEFKRDYRAHITVVPPMKPAQLKKFYARMDMLLLPSHFDVSPFVVLEALAAGTPTVISPQVGHASVFRAHGAGQFVVDFASAPRACATISTLLGSRYPQSLVAALTKLHDPAAVFKQYEILFRQAAQS